MAKPKTPPMPEPTPELVAELHAVAADFVQGARWRDAEAVTRALVAAYRAGQDAAVAALAAAAPQESAAPDA